MRFNRRRNYNYYSPYSRSRYSSMRWDRILVAGGTTLVILIGLIWFNWNRIQLMFKGYSFSAQNDILRLDDKDVDEILSHDEMSHIQEWIKESDQVQLYDEYEKYLSIYKKADVKVVVTTVNDIFLNYSNQMRALGYTEDQIWDIISVSSVDDIQYLVKKQYKYATIQPFMKIQGFQLTDMDQYLKMYKKYDSYNYAVLVTAYPFIISKNKVNQTYTIQNPDNILTLVKKGFQLPSSYVPAELVKPDMPIAPDCDEPMLQKEAADALVEMYKDAKKLGYELVINSAYRSYKDQQDIYDEYFKKYDEVTAASLVAIPGASEHQTGLGVDLTSQSVIKGERLVFGDTAEYQWCIKNSYKYGFILRFEEDKAPITGIAKEPWHFRYVGKDVAKKIYEQKWTLEEYCLYEGVIPKLKEN